MTQQHSTMDSFLDQPDRNRDAGVDSLSLGESLRALREARGWSLADVSARLKFGPRQIEALESDRWEELPTGPSLRGLVRNYARLLDVAPDTLMQALPRHLQARAAAPAPSLAGTGADLPHARLQRWPGGGGRRRRPWLAAFLVLLLICAIALAAYLVFAWWLPRMNDGGSPLDALELPMQVEREVLPIEPVRPAPDVATATTPGVPATPPAAGAAGTVAPSGADPAGATATVPGVPNPPVPGVATAPVPAPLPAAADPAATPPSTPTNQVGLQVNAASWIEIRDASGGVVFSGTLQPGATQYDVSPPARIVIGNAGGVELSWQGNPVPLSPHQRGNVARLTLE